MAAVRIAVAGVGLIGRRHVEEIAAGTSAELGSIVDPSPAGGLLADQLGVACYDSVPAMLAADRPDGVIVATPNALHAQHGLSCIAAGVPVLVEKPLADTVEAATNLVRAAEAAGVPLLVGHHRRHSSIMSAARAVISSGALGRIVALTGTALFYKPDEYFDAGDGWRRKPGGGPILLNLIHEVDNLMQMAGDILSVQALSSSATRGYPVEDTTAMVFRFAGGALGTFVLSDAAASPRSWEQTTHENTGYASYDDEDCYHIAGTRGSLSVPTMRLRTYAGPGSWYEPMQVSVAPINRSDPLANQIDHFSAVIRGETTPVVSGRDGLKALKVTAAVADAARTGRLVETGVAVDVPV